jgi:hypothetical protein
MAKGEFEVPLRRVKGAVTDASSAECPQRRPHSVTIRGGKTASADQRRRDIGLAAPTAPVQRRRVRGQRRVPVCSRSSVVAAIAPYLTRPVGGPGSSGLVGRSIKRAQTSVALIQTLEVDQLDVAPAVRSIGDIRRET